MTISSSNMRIGAVFLREWDSRPIRVIAFDDDLVMYDSWQPDVPGWGIDSLNRTISYYRIPLYLLLSKSKYLRTEEYCEAELSIHRPDLPFSFAQSANLEWPSISLLTEEDFSATTSASPHSGASRPILDTSKMYLHPFGPKGSFKPGVLLESENPSGFTIDEVLWHAARLQSPHLREIKVTTGVGIYRSGIQRKLPSYYVWGAKSRMEV